MDHESQSPLAGPNPGQSVAAAEPTLERPPPREPFFPGTAARLQAMLALIAMVVIADLSIYRALGFSGPAVMLLTAPMLILLARPKSVFNIIALLAFALLLLLAARLIWCGSVLALVSGVSVLTAFALSLNGRRPFVLQTLIFGGQTLPHGAQVINDLGRSTRNMMTREPSVRRAGWLSIVIPIVAATVFGLIFVLANPELLDHIAEGIKPYFEAAWDWLTSLDVGELAFWLAVLWFTAGLIRPIVPATGDVDDEKPLPAPAEQSQSTLFETCRNTLVTLIVLFVVYLGFEFRTLWFREFPQGFYYAGYAHQGAAWLTAALALATFILSLMFRGTMLHDQREPRLRKLAWIWSALNLLLAASVYNRLLIYIDFNGMTRMRTIGLIGTTTVVAGFSLTLWKIHRGKRFLWLIRRDLWAASLAVIVYSIMPVDWLIHTYNVRQVIAGDLAPVVQITEHPVDDEGLLTLQPLLESDDRIIRRGIAAMLTLRQQGFIEPGRSQLKQSESDHWTTWQWSTDLLKSQLESNDEKRSELIDGENDDLKAVFQEFRDYAYQWY